MNHSLDGRQCQQGPPKIAAPSNYHTTPICGPRSLTILALYIYIYMFIIFDYFLFQFLTRWCPKKSQELSRSLSSSQIPENSIQADPELCGLVREISNDQLCPAEDQGKLTAYCSCIDHACRQLNRRDFRPLYRWDRLIYSFSIRIYIFAKEILT